MLQILRVNEIQKRGANSGSTIPIKAVECDRMKEEDEKEADGDRQTYNIKDPEKLLKKLDPLMDRLMNHDQIDKILAGYGQEFRNREGMGIEWK